MKRFSLHSAKKACLGFVILKSHASISLKITRNAPGADPGIFVREGQTFRKFRQAKKKSKAENGRKNGGLWWFFPFCRRN